MAAVFEVGFNFVRDGVYDEPDDQNMIEESVTVAAENAEEAIEKVRKVQVGTTAPKYDNDGNEVKGKTAKITGIVPYFVKYVRYIDHA